MIPPFDERGNLPPGVHLATLVEIEARFGEESDLRRTQMESLRWLVDLARRAGVERLVINGSFVTDAFEPNDVDCALLIHPDAVIDFVAEKALHDGLPFLDVQVVDREGFTMLVERFFSSDRHLVPKGMVEVSL